MLRRRALWEETALARKKPAALGSSIGRARGPINGVRRVQTTTDRNLRRARGRLGRLESAERAPRRAKDRHQRQHHAAPDEPAGGFRLPRLRLARSEAHLIL